MSVTRPTCESCLVPCYELPSQYLISEELTLKIRQEVIERARASGHSVNSFSEKMGVSGQTLAIRKSSNPRIELSFVVKASIALEVDINELVKYEPAMQVTSERWRYG